MNSECRTESGLVPVILAGGSGTRLWPLSRQLSPKQFLKFNSDYSLFQQAVMRSHTLTDEQPVIVCHEEHRFLVAEQLREIQQPAHILLEPEGRNTAPAVTLAALYLMQAGYPATVMMLVMSADHLIADAEQFHHAVRRILPWAEGGKIGIFGISPRAAETGFGYIRAGAQTVADDVFTVAEFTEKPDKATAQRYVSSGHYYWNSGIFLLAAGLYVDNVKQYQPDILQACGAALTELRSDLDFIRVNAEAFISCPSVSLDYAVLEPASAAGNRLLMTPLATDWHDLGSWASLWEAGSKDEHGNAMLNTAGSADMNTLLKKTRGCFIAGGKRLITTLGLHNTVVVDTDDALLIADRSEVQDIRSIVAELQASGRSEYQIHRTVSRPWGQYELLDTGSHHMIKRIRVNPGARLSLQRHRHRAEHWVVVAGAATVTNGGVISVLGENESTYIPAGCLHSLENAGENLLEIIEIQTGDYLSEDDIERLDDDYGRR